MQKIFLAIAAVAAIIGALFATKTLADIDKNIARAKENARPANIKLTKITVPDCNDCFNVDDAVAVFKKQNVSVGEEKALALDSPEAQSLIKQLGIKRLPTYVVTGEISKNNLESFVKNNGEIKNDTFIFTKVTPIFVDAETKKEIGGVTLIYLVDSACANCYDPVKVQRPILTQGFRVGLRSERTVDIISGGGRGLVAKYKITKVPTVVLSPDADQYVQLKTVWKSVGTVESDGWYVFREMQQLGGAIYKDLDKNEVIKPAK